MSKYLSENAVVFRNVSKIYHLQKHRTLKEFLPAFAGRKQTTNELLALNDVSFEIKRGETIGIIGPNGAGKSTILKLIAGVTKPTSGQITVNGRVSPLIELGAGFHPDLTGTENIYLNGSILGLTKKEIDQKIKDIIDFSELGEFIYQPVKHYSSGMYMRLGFSIAVNADPEILLIDEVLAVGDAVFQAKCFARMEEFKKSGLTIVYVSHALPVIKEFCKRAIYIDNAKLISQGLSAEVCEVYQKTLG